MSRWTTWAGSLNCSYCATKRSNDLQGLGLALSGKLSRLSGLAKAAEIVENGIDETLSYYAMPPEHWRCLRTNNPLERLMREIRRRTRVVGAFPDG